MVAEQEGEREGAVEPRQHCARPPPAGDAPRSTSRATRWPTDLGVGLALELRPSAISSSRSGLKFSMMPLWTSATGADDVRMGIADGRRAVRRPARVGDADRAVQRLAPRARARDCRACPRRGGARAGRRSIVQMPGRIIAAIFEPPQPVEQPLRDVASCRRSRQSRTSATRPLSRSSARGSASPSPRCPSARRARPPGCRPRRRAVITDPAPTIAPSPTRTGATSAVFEPMNAPAPITVRYLPKPS